MLLAIDVSNTNIKFGLYNSVEVQHRWVVSTARQRTADEYAMVLSDLLRHAGYTFSDIDDIMLSSVVPPRSALGKNTIENMQVGIIYGHVGLVQGLLQRLRSEIPGVTDEREVKVIAHGGLAQLMAPIIPEIQHVNQYLPLEGLRLAYLKLKEKR